MTAHARPVNAQFDHWSEAIATGDTFRFAKTEGDRALIARVRRRLRELGCDPLSADMLLLSDVEQGICPLVEAAQKLDQLELVLNDTNATDRRTIERIAEVFLRIRGSRAPLKSSRRDLTFEFLVITF